jgi:hypothetical protein
MSTYRVDADGKQFQVIETTPNGAVGFIGGFHSEDDARQWIDDLVRMRVRDKARTVRGRLMPEFPPPLPGD